MSSHCVWTSSIFFFALGLAGWMYYDGENNPLKSWNRLTLLIRNNLLVIFFKGFIIWIFKAKYTHCSFPEVKVRSLCLLFCLTKTRNPQFIMTRCRNKAALKTKIWNQWVLFKYWRWINQAIGTHHVDLHRCKRPKRLNSWNLLCIVLAKKLTWIDYNETDKEMKTSLS